MVMKHIIHIVTGRLLNLCWLYPLSSVLMENRFGTFSGEVLPGNFRQLSPGAKVKQTSAPITGGHLVNQHHN